eukprot:1034018-Rhodomonas_salina.1
MKALEDEQTLYFREHGTYSGDLIRPDGAIELGLGPEVRDEWRDGIRFEMRQPEQYSRAPYNG